MKIYYESKELADGKIKVEFEIDKTDCRYGEVKDFILNKTISEYDEKVMVANRTFNKIIK